VRVASGREGVRRLPRFVLCVVEQKIHLRILERQRRESKRCCVYNGALRMVKELARCIEVGRARPSFAAEAEQITKDEPMPDDEKIYDDAVEIERHPDRKHTRAELRKLRTALKTIYKFGYEREFMRFLRGIGLKDESPQFAEMVELFRSLRSGKP